MKKDRSGSSWKQHSAKYLRDALKKASRTWHPTAGDKKSQRAVKRLRDQKMKINAQIKRLNGN